MKNRRGLFENDDNERNNNGWYRGVHDHEGRPCMSLTWQWDKKRGCWVVFVSNDNVKNGVQKIVDHEGEIIFCKILNKRTSKCMCVVVMWIYNRIGTKQPICDINNTNAALHNILPHSNCLACYISVCLSTVSWGLSIFPFQLI